MSWDQALLPQARIGRLLKACARKQIPHDLSAVRLKRRTGPRRGFTTTTVVRLMRLRTIAQKHDLKRYSVGVANAKDGTSTDTRSGLANNYRFERAGFWPQLARSSFGRGQTEFGLHSSSASIIDVTRKKSGSPGPMPAAESDDRTPR